MEVHSLQPHMEDLISSAPSGKHDVHPPVLLNFVQNRCDWHAVMNLNWVLCTVTLRRAVDQNDDLRLFLRTHFIHSIHLQLTL
ncbi:hypothetical protein [Paenibacillus sp. sgz5001063]|uniref:hypothetical protein n=1 Tax=Paenibacillus sp. sgz5001063 TaxID=3242474 RepID=UPI0036D25CDA